MKSIDSGRRRSVYIALLLSLACSSDPSAPATPASGGINSTRPVGVSTPPGGSMGGVSHIGGTLPGGTQDSRVSLGGNRSFLLKSTAAGGASAQGDGTSVPSSAAFGGHGGASSAQSTNTNGVYLPPFVIGADITITLEDEYWGATYSDGGNTKPLELILKDHGFNFVRIDTFVNPSAKEGYAASMPQPFRDLEHTVAFAKRVKQAGLGFMLDIHYSDTWTNPSAQATPLDWAGLALPELETRVYEYTRDALTQLRQGFAQPDIVQVGNEITNGMLWEVGRIKNNNFANLAALLKAGIWAVREANPAIKVMLHIEKCNNTATTEWWLDGVLAQGVDFDILGQSCYATAPNGVAGYQGTPEQWRSMFNALAERYPTLKFMIAEYSAEQRAANDVMFALPNHRGVGSFNWDPTRAYATHPNHPLFEPTDAWNHYRTIPSLLSLYDQMALDFGLR